MRQHPSFDLSPFDLKFDAGDGLFRLLLHHLDCKWELDGPAPDGFDLWVGVCQIDVGLYYHMSRIRGGLFEHEVCLVETAARRAVLGEDD